MLSLYVTSFYDNDSHKGHLLSKASKAHFLIIHNKLFKKNQI